MAVTGIPYRREAAEKPAVKPLPSTLFLEPVAVPCMMAAIQHNYETAFHFFGTSHAANFPA